jgi:hypothetical protein
MDVRLMSAVSGTALLALTAAASAGPMSVASPQLVTPQSPIESVHYRYHYRHYGWHRGWHYGWYRHRYHYGWRHGYYRRYYGWNPGAAIAGAALGLATCPLRRRADGPITATAIMAALITAGIITGRRCYQFSAL